VPRVPKRYRTAGVMGALVALVLGAAVAAPAQAGWRMDRAQAIAGVVWNDPCGGRVQLVWERLPEGITAQTRGSRPCTILFDRTEPLDWMSFCSYVIHEYGHLAGYLDLRNPDGFEHSSNPDSIMAEFFDNDRRCRQRGRPYLERNQAAAGMTE
jgi:hypothetical protein